MTEFSCEIRIMFKGKSAIGRFLSVWMLGLVMHTACAAEPLRVVYFEDYEPISWSVSNVMRGVLIDIVDEAIVKRMGIAVEHRGYPWARAQAMVKVGDADAFLTVATRERTEYTVAGNEVVLSLDNVAYISARHPRRQELEQVKTLGDLKPYLIGAYLGSGWAKTRLTEHRVHWAPRISTILGMVSAERVDALVEAAQVVRYHVHRLNLDADIIELAPIFDTVHFRLCIRKNSPYVAQLDQFDQVIRAMRKDGTLERIYSKYGIGGHWPAPASRYNAFR